MKNKLKNNNGFTLVETAIFTGLIGIGLQAYLTTKDGQKEFNANLENKSKVRQLKERIEGLIYNDCTVALTGKAVNSDNIIIDGKNSSGLKVPKYIPSSSGFTPTTMNGIEISSIEVKVDMTENPPANTTVDLRFSDPKGNRYFHKIPITVNFSPSPDIIDTCYLPGSREEQVAAMEAPIGSGTLFFDTENWIELANFYQYHLHPAFGIAGSGAICEVLGGCIGTTPGTFTSIAVGDINNMSEVIDKDNGQGEGGEGEGTP